MKDELYINRREAENTLYRQLQEKSLERLQAAAGEVWTDFNPHDPGITISDILNYGLTELDYRLRFPSEDYLVAEKQSFVPERFGLFSPLRVFPVDPVTPVDYRKLFIDRIDKLDNVWIYPTKERGWYEVLAELSPLASVCCREEVQRQIVRIFNAYRNLCEGLREVRFITRKPLKLTGDIELKAGVNALQVLADIYLEAQHFFMGGVRYRGIEELLAEGRRPDELLDGPELRYWAIDESSLQDLPTRYSVAVLFRRLMNLEGVEAVRSLGFTDGEQVYPDIIPVTDPVNSYTVEIPDNKEKAGVKLWSGGGLMKTDLSVLPSLLYARYIRYYGRQNRTENLSELQSFPQGTFRQMYDHNSVQHDFPECYGINNWGVAPGEPELRKAQAKQLKGYMLLYDEVFARGLKELENIPQLMSIEDDLLGEGTVGVDVPGGMWDVLTDEQKLKDAGYTKNRFFRQKERMLEVWEGIYGEDSNPGWLKEYDYYEETEVESLGRRFGFLKRIPEWGRSRYKGVDLGNVDPENVPGIKAYVGSLLGWEMTVEKPVVNVFPMYNLRLVEDDYFYSRPMGLLSHDLVAEDILKPEYMEPVNMPEKAYTNADYLVLKDKLSLLHYNLLFEGLFREGVRPENYHILNIPQYLDRLLVFHHTQRGEWINLGRFDSQEELEETAGCLRRFLIMLNQKSESMYVVEHLLLRKANGKGMENPAVPESENFVVTVVFPGWSVRMADLRFRKECEKLVCSRLPAHLNVHFQWRGAVEMWQFERAYYDWRKALAAGESGSAEAQKLREVLAGQGEEGF